MKRILISLIALLYSTNAYADNVSNLMGLGMPGALAAQIDAQYGSAVSASIVPGADATYDLGTSALSWRSAYLDTSLINTGSAFEIKASTADAADSATLAIAGGGDNLETRGSHIFVSGNESASTGALSLNGGNIATSHISTSINHASALIRFFNASGGRIVYLDNSGNINFDATNGANLVFAKAGGGVVDTWSTVAAAGTVLGDATQMTTTRATITGADGNTGIKVPLLAIGQSFSLFNSSGSILKVWPPSAGVTIGAGAGLNLSAASNSTVTCFYETSTVARCSEAPAA